MNKIKRITAMFMVILTLFSSLSMMTVNAATEGTKTTIDASYRCYKGSDVGTSGTAPIGNKNYYWHYNADGTALNCPIRFLKEAGTGLAVYCIEVGATFSGYTYDTKNLTDSPYWNSLSYTAQTGITYSTMLGMIVGSAYGIFAGNDVSKATDGDTSRDLRTAVSTINSEYYTKIQNIRNGVENLENTTIYINGEVGAMAGVWQDVLAVYAVETAHGENATIAIDFDSSKTQKLRDTFWDMVSISYNVIERPVKEEQEVTDENGNVTTETVEVIYRDLKIYVKTKNASQAAAMYAFSDEQNKVLAEMMSEQFTKSWSDLIYGYSYGDEDIVAVAISQIGNIGGEPYWRWYGLSSRTEWCAIFVSWCADQCGYLDSGVIPKFAWVPDAVSWFQARGQWQPRGYTPATGDIIFFDWEGDGGANHVGIVEYVENGVVHTVEGNSGDACKRKEYAVNSSKIMGYGIPLYS